MEVTGIFPANETLAISFQSRSAMKISVIPNRDGQTMKILIPRKKLVSTKYINIQFQQGLKEDILLEQIKIQGIVNVPINSISNSLYKKYNENIEFSSCTRDGIIYTRLHKINKQIDDVHLFFLPTELISKSRPIGLQLFLRLSFLATLLILLFIFTKQAHTQRFLLFTIALFLASLSLKTDYTTYAMVLMLLATLITFIYNKSRHFTWQAIFYVLCGIYLMNVIGLLYTDDLHLGVKRLDTIIPVVVFPIVFSMIQFTKKNLILLLRFFVWSIIAFCGFGLLSYATIVPELTWDMILSDSKLYAPLLMMWPAHWHPSYTSMVLLMAVPIVLYLRFQDEKQVIFIEMLSGVALPIIFTILSGARIGMVIAPLLLGLGYLFYCKYRPVLKWGLVAAGIVMGGIVLHQFPKADDRFVDPVRSDLRKTAISAIKEKPIFGWGTGYVAPLIQSEERAHSLGIETPYTFNQFHNQYLEDVVQFGIPGMLILLTLFGWMLWMGVREKNYLLLSLLVIYGLFCCTESAFFVAKGIVPFTFWLCFLVANRTKLLQNDG